MTFTPWTTFCSTWAESIRQWESNHSRLLYDPHSAAFQTFPQIYMQGDKKKNPCFFSCVLVCFGLLQIVGESLLYMLQCSLGQAYTASLRQAWLNMYSVVVAAMSRGWAKNGEDKAD